jgi:biopolymer transport protein ExbD
MQIKVSAHVFGYQTRELNLTPVLGITLIVLVALLVGHNTMIGG